MGFPAGSRAEFLLRAGLEARPTVVFVAASRVMFNTDLSTRIHAELGTLDLRDQSQVLQYVLFLKQSKSGMSGAALKQHAGAISQTDAKLMIDAIEAGCEQVNLDEW